MLFYMKYSSQKDIDKIPSSYTVINITRKNKMMYHPNMKNLHIIPDVNVVKDEKERYIHRLDSKYREYVIVLANLLVKSKHANSIVIICSEKDCEKYNLNVSKIICQYIEKRYNYKTFKFTNDVIRSMREQSIFSDKGLTKLIKDMNSLGKLLKI